MRRQAETLSRGEQLLTSWAVGTATSLAPQTETSPESRESKQPGMDSGQVQLPAHPLHYLFQQVYYIRG